MITEHAGPVLEALQTVVPSLTVSDGPVNPQAPPAMPYVVAYIYVSVPEPVGLEVASDRVMCTAIVHLVAANTDATRRVADRVMGALLGFRPSVAGRDCSRLVLADSRPPDWDRSTGRLVVTQVDIYEYVSVPG